MNFKVYRFKSKDKSDAIYNEHLIHGIRPPYFSRDYHNVQGGFKLYFIINTDGYKTMEPDYILNNKIHIQRTMWDIMMIHIINDTRNPHYYEMTVEGGIHIFVDIDGKSPLQTMLDHCDNDLEQWTSDLNEFMIQKIVSILGMEKDPGIRTLVTDSSNKDKFSRHVLYKLPDGQWFDSTQLVGSIIYEIKNQWPKDNKLSIPELKEDGTIQYIFPFDMQVYAIDKSRCFRAIRSSKGEPQSINRFKLPVIDGVKYPNNRIDKKMMLDYMLTYNDSDNQSFVPIREQLLVNYIEFGRLKTDNNKKRTSSATDRLGNRKIQKISDSNIINKRFGININDLKKIIPVESHHLLEQPRDLIDIVLNILNDRCVHWYDPIQGIACIGSSRHDCEILAGCKKHDVATLVNRTASNHKSNHIYWIVKFGKNGYIVQKCHDEDCVHKSGQKIYFRDILSTNPSIENLLNYERPIFTITTDHLFF